jgi:hypothetical protein
MSADDKHRLNDPSRAFGSYFQEYFGGRLWKKGGATVQGASSDDRGLFWFSPFCRVTRDSSTTSLIQTTSP